MSKVVEKAKARKARREALKLPVAEVLPSSIALDVEGSAIEFRKLNEIGELLWLPSSLGEEERNARIVRALELYEGLKPEGSAEGMLAVQMVGTHSMALECLRRASIEEQTFEGREQNLKHAQKLMALYAQQLATLDKHRGKGQQKVTVEHVNVEPGGQAIVGNVEANRKQSPSQDIPALEKRTEPDVEELLDTVRAAKAKIDARRK